MTGFQKLKQRLYNYFNPSLEECLIKLGVIDDPNMTPEEFEEYMKGIDVIYDLVNSYCAEADSTGSEEGKDKDKDKSEADSDS